MTIEILYFIRIFSFKDILCSFLLKSKRLANLPRLSPPNRFSSALSPQRAFSSSFRLARSPHSRSRKEQPPLVHRCRGLLDFGPRASLHAGGFGARHSLFGGGKGEQEKERKKAQNKPGQSAPRACRSQRNTGAQVVGFFSPPSRAAIFLSFSPNSFTPCSGAASCDLEGNASKKRWSCSNHC